MEEEYRSTLEIGIAAFFLTILIVLTLAGNIVVIIAVLTYHRLKEQHSNMFIMNLAIADLFVALLVMVWSFVALITDMRNDEDKPLLIGMELCSMQCAMNYCLIVVSMMTLGFVSVDRFIHIRYPLRYSNIVTSNRIRVVIVWTWIQGVVIGFTPVITRWIHYDYYELVCAIDWSFPDAVTYVIIAFITCFIAPALTMLICYSIILKQSHMHFGPRSRSRSDIEIRKSMSRVSLEGLSAKSPSSTRRNLMGKKISVVSTISTVSSLRPTSPTGTPLSPQHQQAKTSANQHKRIIRSLLAVVFVFFLCMTPFCVTKLVRVLSGNVPGWVNTVATFVQLASSASNPFIYGIFRNEFRKAFLRQYNKLLHKFGCRDYMRDTGTMKSTFAQREPTINAETNGTINRRRSQLQSGRSRSFIAGETINEGEEKSVSLSNRPTLTNKVDSRLEQCVEVEEMGSDSVDNESTEQLVNSSPKYHTNGRDNSKT